MTEQIEAGAELARAFAAYKPLQAAFWLKEAGEGQWRLYLASDQIDDTNFAQAYREAARLLGDGPNLWLESSQVRVTGTNTPLVRDVLEIQEKYPGVLPTRLRNRGFGDRFADEAYIYSLPITTPG